MKTSLFQTGKTGTAFSCNPSVRMLVLLAGLFLSGSLLASPSLSAGSIYEVNKVATISGSGFDAGVTVSIAIMDPSHETVVVEATADEDGQLHVEVVLTEQGTYAAGVVEDDGEIGLAIEIQAI